MTIGIIAAHNLKYSPYVNYYTKILDENNMNYEIVLPNKENIDIYKEGDLYTIKWYKNIPTMINYALYSIKVISLIKKRKYNKLIILTSNNIAYLSLFLRKYFKNQYIIDIRDYTHENIPIFYKLETIGIKYAGLKVLSSKKFSCFLPKDNYIVSHNLTHNIDQNNYTWKKPTNIIKIGYVGSIGYKENCKKLIDLVKNDNRFEFHFFGNEAGGSQIKDYIKKINCNRITYNGPYNPEDKGKIIESLDILFNVYGNGIPLLDYALSNKLYDSFYYKRLILVSPNTYMNEVGGIISYAFDYNMEKDLNGLYNWICELNEDKVNYFQNEMLKKIDRENSQTKKKIINFFQKSNL